MCWNECNCSNIKFEWSFRISFNRRASKQGAIYIGKVCAGWLSVCLSNSLNSTIIVNSHLWKCMLNLKTWKVLILLYYPWNTCVIVILFICKCIILRLGILWIVNSRFNLYRILWSDWCIGHVCLNRQGILCYLVKLWHNGVI